MKTSHSQPTQRFFKKPIDGQKVVKLSTKPALVFPHLAHNGHGLAMWWNLKIGSLEPQPNKNTKVEANKQKPNRITSAETAADSDKMPKLTTSSHHIAKPPVVCSCLSILV